MIDHSANQCLLFEDLLSEAGAAKILFKYPSTSL